MLLASSKGRINPATPILIRRPADGDIEIVEHRADRPGKIVYDDEHQVAAVLYQDGW